MGTVHQTIVKSTILVSLLMAIFCFSATQNSALADGIVSDTHDHTSEIGDPDTQSPNSQGTNRSSPECKVSDLFQDSILQWCETITYYAEIHELSPNLIAAVMLQESGGDHLAYSHSGAVGLLQVMPRDGIAASFMCVNGPCFASRPTIAELQDPEFNIEYGTRFLASLVARFGNIRDALKAYGPMDVGYTYADKVLAIYENYR